MFDIPVIRATVTRSFPGRVKVDCFDSLRVVIVTPTRDIHIANGLVAHMLECFNDFLDVAASMMSLAMRREVTLIAG